MIFRIRPDGTVIGFDLGEGSRRPALAGDPTHRKLGDLLPDEVRPVLEALVAGVVSGASGALALSEPVMIDGGAHSLELAVHESIAAGPAAPGELYVIVRDVSERTAAAAVAREHENLYQELTENLRDGLATTDFDGTIVECNPAFQRLTGYTAEQLARLTYRDITPAKWHPQEERILREQVMTRGYSELYEKEYVHADGTMPPTTSSAAVWPPARSAFSRSPSRSRPSLKSSAAASPNPRGRSAHSSCQMVVPQGGSTKLQLPGLPETLPGAPSR